MKIFVKKFVKRFIDKKFQIMAFAIAVLAGSLFFGIRLSDSYDSAKKLSGAKHAVNASVSAATDIAEKAKTDVPKKTDVTAKNPKMAKKVVQPANKDNCLGSFYGEGETFGVINYNGTESAVVAGTDEEELDHQAMIHRASTPDHIVILGHSYADGNVFGALAINHSEGVKVSLTDISGTEITYSVVSSEWVDEESYNTAEYIDSIFENDSDLVLITCQKSDGVRGRLIVTCEQNQ